MGKKGDIELIQKLTVGELIDGLGKCLENSKELYDSAMVLYKNKNYGTALSLYILNIEELSKAYAIISLIGDINHPDGQSVFGGSYLHKNKLELAIIADEFIRFNKENFEAATDNEIVINTQYITEAEKQIKNKDNIYNKAIKLKNDGLYVCFENGKWISPRNRIGRQEMEQILNQTIPLDYLRHLLNISLRELRSGKTFYVRVKFQY